MNVFTVTPEFTLVRVVAVDSIKRALGLVSMLVGDGAGLLVALACTSLSRIVLFLRKATMGDSLKIAFRFGCSDENRSYVE